jgi:hypothetical protein
MEMPNENGVPPEGGTVVSPFAAVEAVVPSGRRKSPAKQMWLIGASIVVVLAGAAGGLILTRYLNDPLRTLESFPVATYLDGYRALAGSKFKAQLRAEADLGWKEGVGRLMLFTTPDDSRPIVVMVPAAINVYFVKGQTYLAELEVREGGLIYANSCRKD